MTTEPEPQDEILSRDTFGHDDEIGRLFEEYDRLVRWEEHNSRLDATDPVVERAVVRGRIVAFIANTATLQQDAHTSIAEPEPQDVEEARDWMGEAKETVEFWREYVAVLEGERTRWAEREKELVEALAKYEGAAVPDAAPIEFSVPGPPVPKARARVVTGADGRVRGVTPARVAAYEAEVGWAFRRAYSGAPLEGDLAVTVLVAEPPRPPQQRGDLDNYVKAVLDALNGLAWLDDRQVVELHAHVHRSADPAGVLVRIGIA